MERREVLITTSWDDGHPLDLRLATLLKKYGLKGTFYVPITRLNRERIDQQDLLSIFQNFEVGSHTLNHAVLTVVPAIRAKEEIQEGKHQLEQHLGARTKMFAYPRGAYNAKVVQLVEECGFVGARTCKSLDTNYPDSPFTMGVTFQVRPYSMNELQRLAMDPGRLIRDRSLRTLFLAQSCAFSSSWDTMVAILFNYVYKNGGVFHLWGHSWEIDRFGMWNSLNAFLRYVSKRKDVFHVCNSEVIEWQDHNRGKVTL